MTGVSIELLYTIVSGLLGLIWMEIRSMRKDLQVLSTASAVDRERILVIEKQYESLPCMKGENCDRKPD
jgi:hypothetical protein